MAFGIRYIDFTGFSTGTITLQHTIHTEQLKNGMETTTNVMEFIDMVVSSRIQEDSEIYILRRANKTFAKANNRIVMQRRLPKYLHTCEMQRVRLLKINGLMSHQYT